MRTPLSLILILTGCLALVGCDRLGKTSTNSDSPDPASGADNPKVSPSSDTPTRESILGRWTTSTSPDLESARVNMAFLESGEAQSNEPLVMNGKVVTGKIDGKTVVARLITSGAWNLEGKRLVVQITQTNQPSIRFTEPWVWEVVSVSDQRLILERQGEEKKQIALFREKE